MLFQAAKSDRNQEELRQEGVIRKKLRYRNQKRRRSREKLS